VTVVLAAIDTSPAAGPVLRTANALANTLGLRVFALHAVGNGAERGPLRLLTDRTDVPVRLTGVECPADAILAALEDEQVLGAVVGARSHTAGRRPAGSTALAVATRARKPVVVVPPDLREPPRDPRDRSRERLHRVLVPLEGSGHTTVAVRQVLTALAGRGVKVIPLHALDAATAPRFWDRPEHDWRTWSEEFAARFSPVPDSGRLRLRAGRPAQVILDAGTAERADVIALGWSQDLTPGRAAVVREVLTRTPIPLILLPVPLT